MKSTLLCLALALLFEATAHPQTIFSLEADNATGREGIVRYDGAERRPFATFYYRTTFAPTGRVQLTAYDGLVVVNGSTFYELDAASGQMLRRYAGLDARYPGWALRSVAVGEKDAAELGITAGFYGFVICPPAGGPTGIGCSGNMDFPGHGSTTANQNFLHLFTRRPLDPASNRIEVVRELAPPWIELADNRRHVALDVPGRRFWFWSARSAEQSVTTSLEAVPVVNGTIGDPSVVRQEAVTSPGAPDNAKARIAVGFTYEPVRQQFYLGLVYYRLPNDRRLLVQSFEGDDEQTLGHTTNGIFSSVTPAPRSHPDLFTQVLPAIANGPGAHDTFWRSDAWLFNPSDQPVTVTLTRVAKPSVVRSVELAPRASHKLTDVLGQLGGGAQQDGISVDALIIESPWIDGAQLSVYSRTFTPAPDGGSYGQAIAAVPSRTGYSNHSSALPDLADTDSVFILDKHDPDRFRHNLGVVNSGGETLVLTLTYGRIPAGQVPPELEREVSVAPHSVGVIALESLFSREVIETMPPRVSIRGTRPAPLWLSMVDNLTGDASFVPYSIFGLAADPSGRLALPAVGFTPGANGTFWRTDVYGLFPGSLQRAITQQPLARFHPADGGCAARDLELHAEPGFATGTDEWEPFWYTTFSNVARQSCDAASVRGTLELNTGTWTSAFSRTYTTRADGGTYGEMLPLYPPRGWPSRHFGGIELSPARRVNVGLYNGADAPAHVLLRLYTGTGAVIAERMLTLDAHQSVQTTLRDLLQANVPDGLYALSVLPQDGAGCWPYVSQVDNVTGDPTNWW
ncbi:MAG TPA: hypothetical protein VGF69_06420 [Thermoanaerobaculia bacterium]|jgi:hypothetical protein